MRHRTAACLLLVAGTLGPWAPAGAQGPAAASPVRYTETLEQEVRRDVRLPGSVESPASSLVAAEVEGVVERLAAREGGTARRGDPLVVLRRTNLELRLRQTQGQRKEAGARLDLAQSNFERSLDLRASGVISEREFDDAVSESAAWQGRVDALDAEIERVEVDLRRCTIRAPFDGVVVRELTDVGQWIGAGDAVARFLDLDRLEVRVDVPERYFPELLPGAQASVTFESMPELVVDGAITAIIPQADPGARTFPVKVRIPNPEHRIGVGMLAQVSLPLGASYRATLVPKDAVVAQGPQRIVYRIGEDGAVETVAVEVERGMGAWFVVDGPLSRGDRVVTRGNERLMPGQSVRGTLLEYPLP